MISLQLQLFGGRGAKSILGIKRMLSNFENTGVGKGVAVEIDADKFDSLEKWEKEILSREYETLIAFDKTGKPVKAYKGNSRSVSFPESEAYKWKGYTVTHNHPDTYGGTFSFADMMNVCKYEYGQHRAVAIEGTYIIKTTKKSDFIKLRNTIATDMRGLETKMNEINREEQLKYLNTPKENRMSLKSFNTIVRQKYCGVLHRYYKTICNECGFVYTVKPKKKYTK